MSAPQTAPSALAMHAPRRYRVFLSYSHSDTKWARWLMRRLESYAVPKRFQGRAAPLGTVGRRIAPVFRDRDELPTTSDLGETIRGALRESATLVVICSPAAARSRWVQEEITAFKRLHGERGVFAFIVSGEPKVAGAADDCFSPALRAELGADGQIGSTPAEVVAADARPDGDGPKVAFVRLVAGLLGVGFDDLRQRELQRRNRRLMVVTACAVAGMAVTIGLAVAAARARDEAVLARNDAQRRQEQAEDVLAFMLGDFRPELKKVGRLDLLDKVGDKATTYLDSLDPRDLTDSALVRHAQALTQIGEIRLDQKDARFADAAHNFVTAYQRATALVARHPGDGNMIFERAQAEYWIGYVQLKRGNLASAGEWFTRYRDSAVTLVALEPRKVRWQQELASGRHNLAVLDLERGNHAAARAGFLQEMETLRALAAAEPTKPHFRYRQTDVHSWLGNVAHRAGNLTEAIECFAAQRAGLEALLAADPKVAQWNYQLANSLQWQGDALAIVGRMDEARASVAQAIGVLTPMVASDPANRRWLGALASLRLNEAAFEAGRDPIRAAAIVTEIRPTVEKLAAAEPQDRGVTVRRITAWRLETWLRLMAGQKLPEEGPNGALAASERLGRESRLSNRDRGELAQARLLAGHVALAQGAPALATESWRAARGLLHEYAAESNDWCLLDPLARAEALLGQAAESQALRDRLQRLGYQPIEPWPR